MTVVFAIPAVVVGVLVLLLLRDLDWPEALLIACITASGAVLLLGILRFLHRNGGRDD